MELHSPFCTQVWQFPKRTMVEPQPLTRLIKYLLRSLYIINPVASGTYTAAAGTWINRPFLVSYRHSVNFHSHLVLDLQQSFTIRKRFFAHAALLGQGCPIAKIPYCCHSRRSLGRVSVPSVADHPLPGRRYVSSPRWAQLPHSAPTIQQVQLFVVGSTPSNKWACVIHCYAVLSFPIVVPATKAGYLRYSPLLIQR